MTKILSFAAALMLAAGAAYAAPGDTTTIMAHNGTHLAYYGNYDTSISLPDGATSYRSIALEFELGKYACAGYNPSNPGEGPGQTGWCGDWDYDVHVLLMTPTGDTLELAELITPYANSNFPITPLSWTHKYLYDVTDYYNQLKDSAAIRIFYSGYSGGFTGTVRFHFVEGARARDVLGLQPLYRGNFAYGVAANPIEDNVAEVPLVVPAGAVAASFSTIITGHGGISGSNCSEFCKKWLRFKVNGSMVSQRDIWRDDCASNWLAPQSGTWIYSRANWCPGNKVVPMIQDIDPAALSVAGATADIDFQPFTATTTGASYKMSANIFYYAAPAATNDVAVTEILSPTNNIEYRRSNPICGMEPQIRVKNMGSAAVASIEVSHSISGGAPIVVDVPVAIPPMKEAVISLPAIAGSGSSSEQTYNVAITKVNDVADEYPQDNALQSTFTEAPTYSSGKLVVQAKNSGNIGSTPNKVSWQLKDINTGAVVASRTVTATASTVSDTVYLDEHCFQLEVTTPLEFGLSFLGAIPSPGYVRLYNANTGARLPMPDNDLENTSFEGNFGAGFSHYFSVQYPTGIKDPIAASFVLQAYPSPAASELHVKLGGTLQGDITYTLINALGKKVYTKNSRQSEMKIDTESFASGMYLLEVQAQGIRKTEKIMIKHQ